MNEHLNQISWSSFLPLGQTYLWTPEILWTQVLSDALMAIAFFSLPLMVLYFFWFRRKDYVFQSIYVLLAFFLLATGLNHILNIIVTWNPVYQLQAVVKFVTAVSSVSVSFFLWPLLPRALRIPSARLLDQKNQELEFANEKYNLLLAGSRVGVFEWYDLANPQKPVFWSPRMFELLGFPPQSIEPTIDFFISLVHPEERSLVREALLMSSQTLIPAPGEYRLRVGHQYRWFRARHVVKFDQKGRALFVIGSLEDIHDQKTTDEKIRTMNVVLEDEVEKRTRQLDQANKAKTRFLANMSHEMRTPLGLVLGFSEALEENCSLDKEGLEYVHLIKKNGEILSRVINDLLDLSKIEAGKLRFQYSKVPLVQLMDDFKNAFAEKGMEKGVEFKFENHIPETESIVTDEIRLKQIVYNLLSNALKFTDRGQIRLILGKRDHLYHIDVIDTGIGIPDTEKEHVFDEFSRGEMADSGQRIGTGLGLKLAQNLAQALGGHVELVSSQIGKGSHFRLNFRSDEGRLQKQVSRIQESAFSQKLNDFEVYVIDDNEDNIRLAEVFLKKLGCKFRGFTSPRSLFAEMVSKEPDLILLDINMPEMNGFEVFDRLRASGYKNPIWALTAYSLNEDIQAILEHGFDDYIRKPISVDSMRRKLAFELRERSHD